MHFFFQNFYIKRKYCHRIFSSLDFYYVKYKNIFRNIGNTSLSITSNTILNAIWTQMATSSTICWDIVALHTLKSKFVENIIENLKSLPFLALKRRMQNFCSQRATLSIRLNKWFAILVFNVNMVPTYVLCFFKFASRITDYLA